MSKIIWRICEATFAETAFSGEGASIVGGRWNSKGKRMVYTAEHLIICATALWLKREYPGREVITVTTNVKHLSRLINAVDWSEI